MNRLLFFREMEFMEIIDIKLMFSLYVLGMNRKYIFYIIYIYSQYLGYVNVMIMIMNFIVLRYEQIINEI